MFKVTHAVITAAVIAGIFTVVTMPANRMVLTSATVALPETAAPSCDSEPWPYLNCSGGSTGERAIRVIRTY